MLVEFLRLNLGMGHRCFEKNKIVSCFVLQRSHMVRDQEFEASLRNVRKCIMASLPLDFGNCFDVEVIAYSTQQDD